jgi:hypothetical protein
MCPKDGRGSLLPTTTPQIVTENRSQPKTAYGLLGIVPQGTDGRKRFKKAGGALTWGNVAAMTEIPTGVFWQQSRFDAWADAAKTRHIVMLLSAVLLLAAAASFASISMGPRLVREGQLLWFGSYTDGVIEQSTVKQVGTFKDGAPKYELTIDYTFTAPDGETYRGTTFRSDVRWPPDLKAGNPAGIFYEAANPSNSVAEHRLRTDVYALLMFLPFLLVTGFGSALFFLLRVARWKLRSQRNGSQAPSPAKAYTRAPTVKRASRR